MICNLCPRNCGALRTESAGEGYCRMPEVPALARAALHQWEEPPISGTRGSGTMIVTIQGLINFSALISATSKVYS